MRAKKSLYEILRRYEFNRTEPETLTSLVRDAIDKGGEAQKDQVRLRKVSDHLFEFFDNAGLISSTELLDSESLLKECTVGVDGSFQPVGGVGGKWYIPISCAAITFEDGITAQPSVQVEARIERIQEREFTRIGALASEIMLTVETKAIMKWAMEKKKSFLFIDGPVVDPPLYKDREYVEYRCNAIKQALRGDVTVVGCAKRVRDTHLQKYVLEQVAHDKTNKDRLQIFPSDLHLVTFLFAQYWQKTKERERSVFTTPIDVSEVTDIYKQYHENGLTIFSTFVQKGLNYYVLRLDIPLLNDKANDEHYRSEKIRQAVRVSLAWTYPNQSLPLPVFLAHQKCEIRKGCAEVLYQEIMTRTRTAEPFDQMVALQLEEKL